MKGGAAMVQLKSAGSVVEALSYMVKAQSLTTADGAKLSALVQESQQDDDAGAPDPAVYQSQSGGVVDTLNSLLDEAQTQLDQARATETAEGDLEVTQKSLNEDLSALGKLHHDCMSKAQEFEAEVTSRGEELKALATAKKIIKETTSR